MERRTRRPVTSGQRMSEARRWIAIRTRRVNDRNELGVCSPWPRGDPGRPRSFQYVIPAHHARVADAVAGHVVRQFDGGLVDDGRRGVAQPAMPSLPKPLPPILLTVSTRRTAAFRAALSSAVTCTILVLPRLPGTAVASTKTRPRLSSRLTTTSARRFEITPRRPSWRLIRPLGLDSAQSVRPDAELQDRTVLAARRVVVAGERAQSPPEQRRQRRFGQRGDQAASNHTPGVVGKCLEPDELRGGTSNPHGAGDRRRGSPDAAGDEVDGQRSRTILDRPCLHDTATVPSAPRKS